MLSTILKAAFTWLFSFLTGKWIGKKTESHKAAERAVEDYRKAEKIDNAPNLDKRGLRDWFSGVQK